ncbi:hypothetical protein D2V17_02465 [Aurantiacibacter xanthus]|uniref:Lipoprotein n=1 Tax=Aurantiacibacter xanthus TaxID=1784712 RepID=A0A3A1PFT0_9SPHN|nr:hypothetical protein D2V17_02465 [Aurantiacibacter xanthus]
MKMVTALIAALALGGCMTAAGNNSFADNSDANARGANIDTCQWSKPRCRTR